MDSKDKHNKDMGTCTCRRPPTTPTALLFEAALGIDARLLMRTQLDYNPQIAKKDPSFMRRLAHIRKVATVL